jgi:hypothetical protein
MISNKVFGVGSVRNLTGLFLALNGLDAALTLLNLGRGAVELNPVWSTYPVVYSMGIKLFLALVAGLWLYKKGWSVALVAGNIWLSLVVLVNLITFSYLH